MTPGSISGTTVTLDVLRRAYGRSMRPLTAAGSYLDGDGWWAGITGAPDPDYNLALVHNGDVTAHAQHVYDIVTAAGFPAIVLLAGRGLAAAQVLSRPRLGVRGGSRPDGVRSGPRTRGRRVAGPGA